jgi:hypothetical protein
MSARTLAYKVMVLTPAIFLASLAVQSRTYSDPFEPIGQSKVDQAAVSAYIDVMKATKPVIALGPNKQDPKRLRQIAQQWIDGSRKGVLRPLYPVAISDRATDGIKGQVFLAATQVSDRLLQVAHLEIASGNVDDATKDIVQAMEVAQVLKFSSFEAVHMCARTQRKALENLDDLMPKLTAKQAAWAKDELNAIRLDQKPLTQLAAISKRLYMEDRIRGGEDPSAIVVTQQFNSMRRLIDKHPKPREWKEQFGPSMLATTETSGPDVMTMARVAYLSQVDFSTDLETAIRALSKTAKD